MQLETLSSCFLIPLFLGLAFFKMTIIYLSSKFKKQALAVLREVESQSLSVVLFFALAVVFILVLTCTGYFSNLPIYVGPFPLTFMLHVPWPGFIWSRIAFGLL